MYSPLRLVTAAALIAFGAVIGVGVPVLLLSAVERPPVAGANGPGTAENGPSNAGKVEVASAAGQAAEQPLADNRPAAATVPQAPAPQASTPQAPAPETSPPQASVPEASVPQAPAPQALVPQALVPQAPAPSEPVARGTAPQAMAQEPAQASKVATPAPVTPVEPPATAERRVAKPALKAQAEPPAAKKAARRDRIAKKPSTEALNAVRKFGDNLADIPVSSYAADGSRRTIVIRPTSIQDVYYYSAPR